MQKQIENRSKNLKNVAISKDFFWYATALVRVQENVICPEIEMG